MQFHTFVDQYHRNKKELAGVDYTEFYKHARDQATKHHDVFVFRQAMLEDEWLDNKRQYYNIWPAIIPMMLKLKLDIPTEAIAFKQSAINLRLPADNTWGMKSILFHIGPVREQSGPNDELIDGLVILIDTGETGPLGNNVYTFKLFPLTKGKTVQEAIDILPMHHSFDKGVKVREDTIHTAIKICITTLLIGQDPTLVTPDIIAKDREKFEKADSQTKEKLIQKAVRRGKNGSDIGRNLDLIPHYRRPHLALVWTGKGRTTPKIVTRSGSVVHRNKITKIPTGTLD